MEHSKHYPPSGAKNWQDCLAWLPTDQSNYSSRFGTLCHEVAEDWIKQGQKPWAVPPEIAEHLAFYVDYCIENKEFADFYLIEEKLSIACTDSFGTSDFAMFWGNTLEVCDLKTGVSSESPKSDQLKLYALGVADRFDLRGTQFDVELKVFQRGKEKSHKMSCSELFVFEDHIKEVKQKRDIALLEVTGHTNKGNSCFWCGRKPTCPEWQMDIDEFEIIED